MRGVRADRVHQRAHRAVLPPVRPDDRLLDAHLGVQLADAVAGARSACCCEPHGAPPDALPASSTGCWAGCSGPSTASSGAAPRSTAAASRGRLPAHAVALAVYAALLFFTVVMFRTVPSGFVPTQDKQYLVAFAQLPDAATLDRTDAVIRYMSTVGLKQEGVQDAVAFPGLSINGFVNASNGGDRLLPAHSVRGSDTGRTLGAGADRSPEWPVRQIQDAFVAVFPPPPVNGIGTVGRIQAGTRGPRRPRGGGALPGGPGGHGEGVPEPANWPGCSAATRSTCRSSIVEVDRDKVKEQGIAAHRRLPVDAGLPRLALCQRLQQVRPHLPGDRAGRRAVPRQR